VRVVAEVILVNKNAIRNLHEVKVLLTWKSEFRMDCFVLLGKSRQTRAC